jgi:hypothetical protein
MYDENTVQRSIELRVQGWAFAGIKGGRPNCGIKTGPPEFSPQNGPEMDQFSGQPPWVSTLGTDRHQPIPGARAQKSMTKHDKTRQKLPKTVI